MFKFLCLLSCLFTIRAHAEFDWQAHRGGRGLHPENTIHAMKEALKYPITTLELDVVMSKDNKVVVGHEPWMNEQICLTPGGAEVKGKEVNLYSLNYSEIQKYDCGSKAHPLFPRQSRSKQHKPLLDELLKNLKSSGKKFNIEIKSTPDDEKAGYQPDYKIFTDKVISVIEDHLKPEQFTIQSFDWRVLKYLHNKYPHINLVALQGSSFDREKVIKELGFRPAVFSPHYEHLSAADVAWFHKQNIKVIPWTVNSLDTMRKMIAMHVDGIITDYPDLISEISKDSYALKPDCPPKFNRFEGECVKIPTHAEASEQNPGWVCKRGYVQKRLSCVKIKLPRNAEFTDDGKTWICKEGYERYRLKCRKIEK